LFGESLRVTAHRKVSPNNEIVCQRSDGTRVVLPVWMLDPNCSTFVVGQPLISLDALIELRQLLTAVQSRGNAGINEDSREAIDEATTRTSTTPATQPHAGRSEPDGTAEHPKKRTRGGSR
jgi:hypothetical protein